MWSQTSKCTHYGKSQSTARLAAGSHQWERGKWLYSPRGFVCWLLPNSDSHSLYLCLSIPMKTWPRLAGSCSQEGYRFGQVPSPQKNLHPVWAKIPIRQICCKSGFFRTLTEAKLRQSAECNYNFKLDFSAQSLNYTTDHCSVVSNKKRLVLVCWYLLYD